MGDTAKTLKKGDVRRVTNALCTLREPPPPPPSLLLPSRASNGRG